MLVSDELNESEFLSIKQTGFDLIQGCEVEWKTRSLVFIVLRVVFNETIEVEVAREVDLVLKVLQKAAIASEEQNESIVHSLKEGETVHPPMQACTILETVVSVESLVR